MPLTPSKTRSVLEQLGHRPRKPLGQNFLIDGNIVRKSLTLANAIEDDTVIEVGPGLGTLTEALLEEKCHVYAVELDPLLSKFLRETLLPEHEGCLHLVTGDAVDHPRAGLPESVSEFKVVANLPYSITSTWLDRILADPLPREMVLMMQKEAADRITAQPGGKNFGAISIFVSLAYEKTGIQKVSRNCFYPVPGVDSILLHLSRRPDAILLPRRTREKIRQLFTQRRKKIAGLLACEPDAKPWLAALPDFGSSPDDRPEAIPLSAWAQFGNSNPSLKNLPAFLHS